MTVGDLGRRMAREELSLWIAYVEENGPLNVSLRIEGAIARAAAPFMKSAKPRDLMIWPKEPEQEATLDDLFSVIKTAANSRKN